MSSVTNPVPTEESTARMLSGSLEFDRAKLRPPHAAHAIVGHDRLLAMRPDPSEFPVVAVVAPAGYGKSTIVAEWVDHDSGRVLWVTLDHHDDDPATLVGRIATALLESAVSAPELEEGLRVPGASVWSRLMPRLSAALQDAAPFTLVFDDAHRIAGSESWDIIDWLMLYVPEQAQVVVAGRSLASSAMPRLEAGGRLATLGTADLALSDAEAWELLEGAGLATSRTEATRLTRACQGWVSGLLMSGGAAAPPAPGADPTSQEDLIDRYVEQEVLRPLSPDEQEFMLQASILRVASGPLCDAVLDRSDSYEVLGRLCSSNAFMSKIGDGWCQTHELVRSALLRKVEQRGPELVATLRDRAATWHAEHGSPAEAVHYSMESGASERTIDLIGRFVVPLYSSGQFAIVSQWLDWAEETGLGVTDQSVMVAASVASALAGDPERSERWATASRRSHHGRSATDEGYRALVAAWQCQRGAEAMLEDASRARELVPEESPLRKSALASLAVAQSMHGHDDESETLFREVMEEGGPAWSDTNARSGSMAFLAILALRQQHVDAALELVERASLLRQESHITEHALQALVEAVMARLVLIRGGDVQEARGLLAHTQQVRSLTTWAAPSLALSTRLELIKAHLALADVAGARVITREVSDILRRRPGLGAFEAEANELRGRVVQHAETSQGPSSLTAAELRLVPWLTTHLSFREIGERLFLSTNTVKTEALSTYRKLGASSRSEAVEAAVHVGLLDPASLPGILGAGAWKARAES